MRRKRIVIVKVSVGDLGREASAGGRAWDAFEAVFTCHGDVNHY